MRTILLAALLIAPAAAMAQDLQPAFDLPALAQGQVISSTAKGYADRGRERRRSQPRRATSRRDCYDIGSLQARVGSLSRDDYMRYRTCQGLSN